MIIRAMEYQRVRLFVSILANDARVTRRLVTDTNRFVFSCTESSLTVFFFAKQAHRVNIIAMLILKLPLTIL